MKYFLRENPIFEWGPRYEFEACGSDNNEGILVPEQQGDDNCLNREARRCVTRLATAWQRIAVVRLLGAYPVAGSWFTAVACIVRITRNSDCAVHVTMRSDSVTTATLRLSPSRRLRFIL